MVAKARCRCGTVLRIRCGRAGYKMRCPVCHSLVRVQKPKRKRQRSEPVAYAKNTPVPGNTLLSLACQEIAEGAEGAAAPRPPMVEMVPFVPAEPPSVDVPVWQRWPVWLAGVVAVALVIVVLMLVSRT